MLMVITERFLRVLRRVGVFYLLFLCITAVEASPAVESVRVWRSPDSTRLVFDLNEAIDHKVFRLDNPDRLVIDLPPADFRADLAGLTLNGTPVADIRNGLRDDGGLRLVLDLRSDVKPRSFALTPNENYGHRLVFDLDNSIERTETSIADVLPENRDIIIAIDAGHGGEDPGATGPGRVLEKDVVLKISQRLAARIDEVPGYKAVLVRGGDYFVALKKRANLARDKRADFFVSIHADAFHMSSVHGASVYALSGRRASSESARYLADRANRSDLIGGVGALSLRDKDDQLASVLLDLSMNATLDISLRAGEMVLAELGHVTKLHKPTVEQAGFAVLKSPDMPSLLIETGFISNPDEARRLATRAFQDKVGDAIFTGIRNYFSAYPPAGTLVASRASRVPEVYLIQSGDTLSEIAERYNISVARLKAVNKLSDAVLYVGQKLEIPAG